MMMYKYEVKKLVWRNDEKQKIAAYLYAKFELPFAPFPGLAVKNGNMYFVIEHVEWNVEESFFYCYTKDESMDDPFNQEVGFDKLVELKRSIGWLVEIESDN